MEVLYLHRVKCRSKVVEAQSFIPQNPLEEVKILSSLLNATKISEILLCFTFILLTVLLLCRALGMDQLLFP